MRLRPSPLVESTSAVAVGILVLMLWDFLARPATIDLTNALSYQVLLFLIPPFILSTLLGFIIRNQRIRMRFAFQSLLTSIVAAAITIWFSILLSTASAQQAHLAVRQFWATSPIICGVGFELGLFLTYFFVVSEKRTKLNKSQYVVNPSISKTKKRKK